MCFSVKVNIFTSDELQGAGEDIKGDETKIYRAKRLLFVENRRPAYFGTWRKKSSTITARRPLAVDTVSNSIQPLPLSLFNFNNLLEILRLRS